MNLLIVLPRCGHELLLATVIIALTLFSERHLGYGRQNDSDVKAVLKRHTECLKTLTVGLFRSYAHTEKKQEYWSTEESSR